MLPASRGTQGALPGSTRRCCYTGHGVHKHCAASGLSQCLAGFAVTVSKDTSSSSTPHLPVVLQSQTQVAQGRLQLSSGRLRLGLRVNVSLAIHTGFPPAYSPWLVAHCAGAVTSRSRAERRGWHHGQQPSQPQTGRGQSPHKAQSSLESCRLGVARGARSSSDAWQQLQKGCTPALEGHN